MQILYKCSVSNVSEVLDTEDDCARMNQDLCSILWGALRCGTASAVCFPTSWLNHSKAEGSTQTKRQVSGGKKNTGKENSISVRDPGGDRACLLEFTEVLSETGRGLLPHYSGL